jgi:hypothetical protein
MISTKLTYFNGIRWCVVLFPDGARAVLPYRLDGHPVPGARTRYFRKPGRVNSTRQPASAAA